MTLAKKFSKEDIEAIEFYMDYLEKEEGFRKDDPFLQIQNLVVKHKYGDEFHARIVDINFTALLNENKCPSCKGMFSLKEKAYVCGACSFHIPLELYDKAKEYMDFREEEIKFMKEYGKKGYGSEGLQELINEAKRRLQGKLNKNEGK